MIDVYTVPPVIVNLTIHYVTIIGATDVNSFISIIVYVTVLYRCLIAHKDEYGRTSYTYHVTVRFAARGKPVTLEAMISEKIYRATERGQILTVQYANADPRIALLGNEIDAYPAREAPTLETEHKQMDAEAYYGRGMTYHVLGEYQEALCDYARAIEMNPERAKFYHSRGITHRRLFEWENAVAAYDKAIELNTGFAEAYYDRGIVYKRVGQVREAISDFERFLALAADPQRREMAEQQLRELRSE